MRKAGLTISLYVSSFILMGGAICCDTAEDCDFVREAILLRCEHAEEVIIGKEVQNEG